MARRACAEAIVPRVPTITAAVLAYAAGLVVAFAGGAMAGCAAAALLAVRPLIAAHRPRNDWPFAVLVVAGVVTALADVRVERRCAGERAARRTWTVALETAAAQGATARGIVDDGGGCVVAVTARIVRGTAAAGEVVMLGGVGVPTGRGVLIREATLARTGRVHRRLEWRARAAAAVDQAFGDDAGLARALLLADTRGIPDEVRDRFAAAGLVHVLSISGLHVSILTAALELLFGAARLSRRAAGVTACAAAALYVALIGFPAPAVRAVAMLAAATASRLLQRPSSSWAALALGAAAPLVFRPRTVLDLGYQLSVLGMAALIAGGAVARRRLEPRLRGWRLTVGRELATSTIATMVTAPLVLWWFGQVSLAGPVANLVAAPIVAVLQPTLFLALAAAPAPAAARFVAGAAHPLLVALDWVARSAAAPPWAVVHVAPTLTAAALCAVVGIGVVAACVSRAPARPAAAALAGVAALAWWPSGYAATRGSVELHMLDVGQGDALALRTPAGRWVLFDAGPAWASGDAARAVVIPYVRRRGGAVAAFVLSHPHLDHVGGAATIIESLDPAEYWDAGYPAGGERYRASLAQAAADGTRWHRARAGDSLVVDGVRVRFLAPDSAWAARLPDANDASTVALVEYGAVRFLLVGDAERGEEDWLLAHARSALRADVLKVGHHGSRTSTTPAFLAAVQPRVALVSVGLGNEYGHPSPDVVTRLAASGAEVLRTDLLGAVVVRTDGRRLTIVADDTEWPVSSRSSDERWPSP